jgi:hypothetical protein
MSFSPEELKHWKIGSQSKRPNFTMVEYIPKDQVIDDWHEMVTLQIFHNASFRLPQLMAGMKASFETKQPCEQAQLLPIGAKKMNGYDTSMHMLMCTKNKQNGKGELTLMLGIQGRDAVYLVQRAWRGAPYTPDSIPLAKKDITAWTTFLNKVQVCDPRAPEHACPRGLQRAR